ncbi:MAG: DNA-processing protein DprA, partial [Planctomycetes bacterium]|nr:DNA-processing protein DprA [Planctomycetota bacterium]
DIIYPSEHTRLHLDTLETGALLSEFPLGTQPLRHHFPRRNRIISGLSKGVLIVEASKKSGSLITADHGLEQGRTVMAVPGTVGPSFFQGSNQLIRDGACVVLGPEDVLAALHLPYKKAKNSDGGERTLEKELKNDPIAACCSHEAFTIEELVDRSGMDQTAVLCRVSRMEMEGKLKRVPGGRFLLG